MQSLMKNKLTRFNELPILIFKKIKPKPSIVFNTYWKFAAERQNIFFKRINGDSYPYTLDKILAENKFTNVFRASDRVSQYLIRNVIYKGSQKSEEIFFRIILFKIFNRISTWEYLEKNIGCISYHEFSYKIYDKLLMMLMNNKKPIYSAAYIMASGRSTFKYPKKHQNHLKLIELMIREGLHLRLQKAKNMNDAFHLLLSYPSIGKFLAYQYITDINYSNLTDFNEMEFVMAGPGAIDGIMKCFVDIGDYSYEDIIRLMADSQAEHFKRLNLNFNNLWGRDLQLIDCQNIFCEVDKYARIAHPRVHGISKRTKIKQKFHLTNKEEIKYFFPPKWNINFKEYY
jgi:hypothetical protein